MLNASVGAQRVLARVRRSPNADSDPATRDQATSVLPKRARARAQALVQATRIQVNVAAESAHLRPQGHRRRPPQAVPASGAWNPWKRLGAQRSLAIALAGLLLIVSAVSLGPTEIDASGDIGGPTGDGPAPRLAIGGGSGSRDASDRMTATGDVQAAYAPLPERRPVAATAFNVARLSVQGPFLDDGTLLKPVAVDTTVDDGRDLVRRYTVKSGDTLAGIARQFGVSVMSVWWANKLKSKDDLHGGLILRIPPVNGLIVTVKSNETLASIARTYDVDPAEILSVNRLADPSLVVGQILIMPGAKGEPLPTPKPTPKPKPVATRSTPGRVARRGRPGLTAARTSRGRPRVTASASPSIPATTASTSTATRATRSSRPPAGR